MQVMLKNVRLRYADVHEPREQQNGGLKYAATVLIDKNDAANTKAIRDAMRAAATDVWKDKASNVLSSLEKNRKCLRDGDTYTNDDGEVRAGFEGQLYVVAKSKNKPKIFDPARKELIAADGKPYPGCYVNVLIDVYATAKREAGGNGVFAELKGIQFWRDGDAFAGGSAPVSADAFEFDENYNPNAQPAGNPSDEWGDDLS